MAKERSPGSRSPRRAAAGDARARRNAGAGKPAAARSQADAWRLEEAKARFSEVVRRARAHGPQYVTVRGKPAVAVVDVAELERMLPPDPGAVPLVQFLEGLHVGALDLTRERDPGRDIEL